MTNRQRAPGSEDAATRPPALSALLAGSGALPPVALGLAACLLRGAPRAAAERAQLGWSAALLCFFGGVRRGLSFRQQGGASAGEIGTTLLLFMTGAAGLALPGRRLPASTLAAGFGVATVLDWLGAREGEAPRYFARLRPVQFPLIAASLLLPLSRRAQGPRSRN